MSQQYEFLLGNANKYNDDRVSHEGIVSGELREEIENRGGSKPTPKKQTKRPRKNGIKATKEAN